MSGEGLRALAAKVEALQGPCRETDGLIYIAVCIPAERAGRIDHNRGVVGWWPRDGAYVSARQVPEYTASLDAALSLMPEGWKWTIHSPDDDGPAVAYCVPNMGRLPWPDWVTDICAATPALALVSAALRARATNTGDHHE